MFDHGKIREEIYKTMQLRDLKFTEMAKLLGVNHSFLWRVVKGQKNFSEKNIKKFCEFAGCDIDKFIKNRKIDFDFADALDYIVRIKEINLVELSDLTGIGIVRLSDLRGGLQLPTEPEIKKISEILNVTKDLFDSGTLPAVIQELKLLLTRLHISDNTKDTIITLIERDIRKPPTI